MNKSNNVNYILLFIGISLLIFGSFTLGTAYPRNGTFVTPKNYYDITSRQNIVIDNTILVSRGFGPIGFRTLQISYDGLDLELKNIFTGDRIWFTCTTNVNFPSPYLSGFDFSGYRFIISAWNYDYVQLEVAK